MAFKIYTKTGDQGETGLFGGTRLSKHHIRIEAYGTVDELNAQIGLLRDHIEQAELRAEIKHIQDLLFTVGSLLATTPEKEAIIPGLQPADIEALELAMDRMDATLPPLKNFILPGGHPIVSYAHIARCVCRRAERNTVALAANEPVDALILSFLNRLSDYFFMLGRYLAKELGVKEVAWAPREQ
ncbi:MAG: cob(I)yrinic acid a,c-diamide adenosyltransferase [Bacteroidota bacterium]